MLVLPEASGYELHPDKKKPPTRSGLKSREETPKKGCGTATPSLSRSAKLGTRGAARNRSGPQQPHKSGRRIRLGALPHHMARLTYSSAFSFNSAGRRCSRSARTSAPGQNTRLSRAIGTMGRPFHQMMMTGRSRPGIATARKARTQGRTGPYAIRSSLLPLRFRSDRWQSVATMPIRPEHRFFYPIDWAQLSAVIRSAGRKAAARAAVVRTDGWSTTWATGAGGTRTPADGVMVGGVGSGSR